MHGVFAAAENDSTSGVITAARGRIRADLANDRFLLALYDGQYYEGKPGERKYRDRSSSSEFTRPILFPRRPAPAPTRHASHLRLADDDAQR